jgi:uncharacterized protein
MSTPSLKPTKIFYQLISILSGILGIGLSVIYFMLKKLENLINLDYLSFIAKSNTLLLISSILILISLAPILIARFYPKYKYNDYSIKSLLITIFSILLGSFLVLFIFFFLTADFLIDKNNLIFQPSKISKEYAASLIKKNVEEIVIKTPDNCKLHGWLVKNNKIKKSPLIIYFPGSGQESSSMIEYTKKLPDWSFALINYRGFGLSEGRATEKNSFNDAKLIYDTLSKRSDIDNKKIITMGWSLGTAISTHLASERTVKGTILVAPMDSMVSLFQPMVKFIPLSLIMKEKFDSLPLANKINSPLLCLIGDNDTAVPNDLSIKLAKKWKGSHTIKVYKNENHGLLFSQNNSWQDIADFLENLSY